VTRPARRLSGGLAALVVVAGCSGNASPNLTATAKPETTYTATPTASPTVTNPPAGQMSRRRSDHTATLLAGGRVLIVGGYDHGRALDSANLFDPGSETFIATGSLAAARSYHTATLLQDGRVLVVGGTPRDWTFNGPFLTSAELFDPLTGMFTPTGSLATARNLHTATLLLDGRVLIVGGNDSEPHSLASAELYDPKTGTFNPTGSMATARGFHAATLLDDGRVLVTGGTSAAWDGPPFLASAELYDPVSGTFSPARPMTEARASHTATLLADGRVLLTGGIRTDGGETSVPSAELYDPKTSKFTLTGHLADGRTFHEATLLADGRVLVTGGDPDGWKYGGPFLASAEIYDPATGRFATTGPMADAITSHSATRLADGRVLIAGGYDGVDLASAEIYDPDLGAFRLLGSR